MASAVNRPLATAGLAALLVALAALPGAAQPGRLERQVKAAFLYKFAGYVDWPAGAFPDPSTPLRIGVCGDEAMVDELRRLVAGRTSGGRPVDVASVTGVEAPAGIHLLFVADGAAHRLDGWIEAARQHSVLVVTESPGALRRGSMINFVPRDGRVRFEVGLASAEKSGLQLSSRLLSVAQAVITRTP